MSRLFTPRGIAWAYAAFVSCLLARFLLETPVQLTDSFQNIVSVAERSLPEIFLDNVWAGPYFRPMLFVPIKIVYELSGGHYAAWYRGAHTLHIVLTIALFVQLLRVRSWTHASLVPLALAGLVGMHTFAGVVREAFPINAYVTVVDACLIAALVSSSVHRWWSDVVALAALVVAALSVESGLLVWVVLVAGYFAGWRGVSRRGIGLSTVALAAYFVFRFSVGAGQIPGLDERSTGFGLQTLEPEQAIARFGSSPWTLYAYNVAASIGSVLFAEPRGGVFWILKAYWSDGLEPFALVNLLACAGFTALLIGHVVSRWNRYRRWTLEPDDQLIVVFGAVLVANATLNFVYTKDVIMSPAGVLFAAAAFAAASRVVDGLAARTSWRTMAAGLALVLLAVTWSIKAVGVHYSIRYIAREVRDDWAFADTWVRDQEVDVSAPRVRAIKDALQADAILHRDAIPDLRRWAVLGQWFDTSQ